MNTSKPPPYSSACCVEDAKAGSSQVEACGCTTLEEGSWQRTAIGWVIIAMACGFTWLAYTVSALFWPVVFVLAWVGAYQTVYAKGCRVGAGDSHSAPPATFGPEDLLDTQARRTRLRMGVYFLLAAGLVSTLAIWRWVWLWPLAFLPGWFGASFLIAAATRYPGCPEVGAIPSLVLRRPLVTRCPPMERLDHRIESGG